MRWLADECIPARLVRLLRQAGEDVEYIIESNASVSDVDVLNLASREQRLLLTEDKGFGELIFGRTPRRASGVVLLRIWEEDAHLVWPRLKQAIHQFGDGLFGRLLVVEKDKFRSRSFSDE